MENEKKALDRLHTDASQVQGPDASGKVWLNSASVVDRIIRGFVSELLDEIDKPESFQSWLEFKSRALNNLFLGITPSDEYKTGPWNRPDQCGEYVLKAMQINGETRLSVRDAFFVFTSRVLTLIEKDFDADALDAEIDRLRHALLGTAEAE